MGLLDELFSYIDSKKRVLGSNLSDIANNPAQAIQTLLTGAGEDVKNGLLGFGQDAQTALKSAVPGIRDEAAARATSGLLSNSVAPLGVTVYHGTPHQFSSYDLSKIGTGEGAQAYGHGMYFAENPETAQSYQKMVTGKLGPEGASANGGSFSETATVNMFMNRKAAGLSDADAKAQTLAWAKNHPQIDDATAERVVGQLKSRTGNLLQQDLPDSVLPRMLQWDKPLSEQPEAVKKALAPLGFKYDVGATGSEIWDALRRDISSTPDRAAEKLRDAGIPGLSYLDAGSRAGGKGTLNHVIWDQGLLDQMVPTPWAP